MKYYNKNFLLLQINDALFPIGGYSHSYGLETYIQKEIVRDEQSVYEYICNNLLYNLVHTDLLAAKLAYVYASEDNLCKVLELEELVEASKNPEEIRMASRKLGSRFLKTVDSLQIEGEREIMSRYMESGQRMGHHSVAYGAFCSSCEILWEDAVQAYLYAQTSAIVTNCVKSVPLSQTAGQQILYRCYGIFEKVMEKLEQMGREDLFLSTPAFDIRAMQHENLYSRIYMS